LPAYNQVVPEAVPVNMDPSPLLRDLAGHRAAVVGDAILDVYVRGNARGLCREAPATVVALVSEETVPGAAANAAVNVAALGGTPTLLAVTGDDDAGRTLLDLMRLGGVDTRHITVRRERRTLVKRRICAGDRILLRLDEGTTEPLSTEAQDELVRAAEQAAVESDAIIISDYGWGTVTDPLRAVLASHRSQRSTVVVDAKELAPYRDFGPDAVTPDYAEAVRLLRLPPVDSTEDRLSQLRHHSQDLVSASGAGIVVVTLGRRGALLVQAGHSPVVVPAYEGRNGEVVGAGDVVAAAVALSLAAGAHALEAAGFAMRAASTAVNRAAHRGPGTAVAPPDDLATDKVATADQVARWANDRRGHGQRIVFTNGCFDLVHEGHLAFLSQARTLGDVLVVAVNDDASVRELKGPDRPVVELPGRVALLAALSFVDRVVPFSGPSPVALIEAIRPHVFAKGGDYVPDMIPETDVALAVGAEIRILSYVDNRSTSHIIDRVRASAV
jgi:D-beta-D-heptose 7-phosphate kinase/D-beta-D-heptose 1-phosphate adenosyltransferase